MDDEEPRSPRGLEAQRVFASVARSLLGESVSLPTIGRFEVSERLGSGGMGEVYGAYDPVHEREVALKLLRSDLGADLGTDLGAMGRLRREARALARLDHPHVVQVYEVGSSDSRVFVAMERLRGETLAHCLEREGSLPAAAAWPLLSELCDAMGRAHASGIIHRDLKPANIFLATGSAEGSRRPERPRVKVLDFGIAKGVPGGTFEASTASGTVMGTPHYMSPEQARDSTKVDSRCDLWAVAIIAYECIVGRRPFRAQNLPRLAVELLTEPLPIPSEHSAVPAGFDAWFARAAHRDLEQRYATAPELALALADALGQPRPPWVQPARPGRWWLVVVVVAVSLVALGWWWSGREPETLPPEPEAAPALAPPLATSPLQDLPPSSSGLDSHSGLESSSETTVAPDRTGSPRAEPRTPASRQPREPEATSSGVDDLEF